MGAQQTAGASSSSSLSTIAPTDASIDTSPSALLPISALATTNTNHTANPASFMQMSPLDPLLGDDCFAYFNPRSEAGFHQIIDVWDSALNTMAEYFIDNPNAIQKKTE